MHLVGFGDRRKAHDLPRLLREHVADEVVLVQPLHDDDDGAMPLVVEPAVEGVDEPLVGGLPPRLGERLLRLQRIVDQDDVGTASGQHAAGRGGQPVALAGGDELLHRLAVRRQAGRKDPPIPRAHHDAAAIAGELVGEILGIADAQDLRRRVVAETPGRKGDRGHQRFEVARRQVDDQPPKYLKMLKCLARGGHGWKIGWKMLFRYRSGHPPPVDGPLAIVQPHAFWPGFSGCIVPWW